MQTSLVQRWREHRASYRPAGEPIQTHHYEVAPLDSDNVAKAFIAAHHYEGTYPTARRRFGLYRRGDLVGVAVFSVAQNYATYAALPGDPHQGECADLGRFVLLDDVPSNGETWFLARAFEQLRAEGFVSIVSFSDPVPRDLPCGREVFPGHVGTIYQAHNAVYLGRSAAETKWLLPDGTIFCGRSQTKIRKRRQGWQYSADKLVRIGAAPLRADEDSVAWVKHWRAALCRPLWHAGNHKYAWALPKRARRFLPSSRPYPKAEGRMAA